MPSLKKERAGGRTSAAPGAYSRLSQMMQARHLTVKQLTRDLAKRGYRFDPKTIYRLASEKPLRTINTNVVRAVCETLHVDIGQLIVWEAPAPKLRRVDAKTQKRLDYLMARANEGELTKEEEKEMEERMADLENLSIENAKIPAQHKAAKGRRPSKRKKTIEA